MELPRKVKSLKRMLAKRRRNKEREQRGRLTIPGVHWKPAPFVQKAFDALRDDLEPWVNGESDIPVLRHVANDRLMHAQGRVSMAKTLLAISLLKDYRTSNVGTPWQDKKTKQWYWLGRSIKFIADVAGISYWACKRRIDWLVKRGGMSRHQQAGTDDQGVQYGRPSIRNVFSDFFQCIGEKTWKAVKAAQETAYQIYKEGLEVVESIAETSERLAQRATTVAAQGTQKVRSRTLQIGQLIRELFDRHKLPYNQAKRAPP
jgi:hypothetical protein